MNSEFVPCFSIARNYAFQKPLDRYTNAFPNLYGKDRYHFSAAVAARAFLEIVTDAVKHVRTISGNPQRIVVDVCAGWNAEPTKGAQPVGSIHCQTALAFMAQPGENLPSHRTGDAQLGENLVSQGDAQPA